MHDFKDHPLTHDQAQRYTVLQKFLERFYPGTQTRVLDVGGLSPDRRGQAQILPLKLFHSGPGIVLDPGYCSQPDFVQGDGKRLPFPDNFFDVVSALDVLEHIPAPDRKVFLKELIRVSRGSVFLCAPYQDKNVEQTEALLSSQIKALYGVAHQQLREHQEHGLPQIQQTAAFLARHTRSGTHFAYGSLTNWMVSQSLKNTFMFRRSSPEIHYFLDKWLAGGPQERESVPPFYRNYWIYSLDISPQDLSAGIEDIRTALKKLSPPGLSPHEFTEFHQALVDYRCADRLAALVVAEGLSPHLPECLAHVLTQKVQMDLEVSVWDLHSDPGLQEFLKNCWPGVKYIVSPPEEALPNAFYKVVFGLEGDYILLLSGDILCPADTMSRLYSGLKDDTGTDLLVARIAWHKEADPTRREGDKRSAGKRADSKKARGIHSECQFFRKEAVFSRKWRDVTPAADNIFFWERGEISGHLKSSSKSTVYKK